MTAPVASGWSGCRVGLTPTGKRRLATAHTQNGIYIAGPGTWVYAADFANNKNIASGSLVLVTSGSVNQGSLFEQTCTDSPIVIGTSLITFSALANNTAQAATSTTSLAVGTGAKTLTIQAGKSFAANQFVIIYETSAPTTNVMLATVTQTNGNAGASDAIQGCALLDAPQSLSSVSYSMAASATTLNSRTIMLDEVMA
jgi:hypothetical protein